MLYMLYMLVLVFVCLEWKTCCCNESLSKLGSVGLRNKGSVLLRQAWPGVLRENVWQEWVVSIGRCLCWIFLPFLSLLPLVTEPGHIEMLYLCVMFINAGVSAHSFLLSLPIQFNFMLYSVNIMFKSILLVYLSYFFFHVPSNLPFSFR